jgi:putative nucleotidyltransferase with HDIG domain
MRLFRTESNTVIQKPATVRKPPVVEGWSEQELVSVYNAAPIRHLKKHDLLLADTAQSDSFFVLLDGAVQISVKWDSHAGRPGIFKRGDCMAPLPKSPGMSYRAEAAESCTLIEITPAVMNHLPDKVQLSVYKAAVASTSQVNAYIRAVNGEVMSKNALLATYVVNSEGHSYSAIQSKFVQDFLRDIPQMPTYAMALAAKLLDERTSLQEVVEGIKNDPSIAGIVLRTVNSAQCSFEKKIESFYHACMILGFNNIYNLILREAVKSAMPATAESQHIHTHSCLVSMLCYEIASTVKEVQSQTATTIGLLHDVGKGVKVLMKIANPEKAEYIGTLHAAKLGADLLRLWGLPDRVCDIVELQHQPEFTPPDLIAAEYRREAGTLHIAHVMERLLEGKPVDPASAIYTRDYMATLGTPDMTPAELLNKRILPNLVKNVRRMPEPVQQIISRASAVKN